MVQFKVDRVLKEVQMELYDQGSWILKSLAKPGVSPMLTGKCEVLAKDLGGLVAFRGETLSTEFLGKVEELQEALKEPEKRERLIAATMEFMIHC